MSWRLILLLIPVAVSSQQFNGNFESGGLRIFRQLDLGVTNSQINTGKPPENIILQTIDPTPLNLGLTNSRNNAGQAPENIFPQTIDPGLVRNGYLPPVSSPAPPQSLFEGEQSRENFEFVQENLAENKDILCNGPSGSDLCQFKNTITSANTNIVDDNSKLSKHLIPPLVDSEPLKESLPEHIEEPKTTTSIKPTVTTTKKPATEKTISTNPVKPFSPPKKFTEPKKVVNLPEPSDESKNYLPPRPEYSSAAQTPEAAVRFAPREEEHHHHHHHHHHHDENYDICSDPFHSFLCSPLKARKRITGAFPENLRGQASFNQFQKIFPQAVKTSSKPLLNQDFPSNKELPKISAPSFQVETTTFLPKTTQKQKLIPPIPTQYFPPKLILETSNENDRFYLPPLPVNKQFDLLPTKPDSSNAVIKTITVQKPRPSPSTYTEPKINLHNTVSSVSNKFSTHFTTTKRPVETNPVVTTVQTKAIQKLFGKTAPLSSTQTKVTSKYSVPVSSQTTVTSSTTNIPLTPTTRPLSSGTFYRSQKSSKQLNLFEPFQSINKPQDIFQQIQEIYHISTNIDSTKPSAKPSDTEFKSQKNSYFASTSSQQFTTIPQFLSSKFLNERNDRTSTKIQSSFASPSATLVHHPSASKSTYQSSNNFISTTEKALIETTKFSPSGSTVSVTAGRRLDNAFSSSPFQFSTGKRVKPSLAVANVISTTIKPFASSRNVFGSITETLEKHSTINNSYSSSRPNEQSSAAQIDSVIADQNDNVGKDICSDPFHSFLCSGSKSRKRITGAVPNAVDAQSSNVKESELKPVPIFQSRNTVTQIKQAKADSATLKPIARKNYEINNLKASEARTTTGYKYSKPEVNFPLPSDNAELIKTADTSYYYPKPEKEFPLPTEQERPTISQRPTTTVTPSTTTTTAPTTTTPAPTTTTPAPTTTTPAPTTTTQAPTTTRRTPTTTRRTPTTPTTPTPVTTTVSSSTSLPQSTGYHYEKPEQSFELPDKQGYSYPKPEKRFELPTENKFKPLFSENSKSTDVFKDLGSAIFIPVNKLDKRSDGRSSRSSSDSSDSSPRPLRFGERIRKLEKRPTNQKS